MVNPSPSTVQSSTTITDVDVDSLAHCAAYLDLQDISNMAMSCKFFQRVAYSDSIWHRFFREHWPQQVPSSFSQTSGVREAYLARRTALQQFKFVDPLVADFYTEARPYNHVLLDKNEIIFSQGSVIQMMKINSFFSGRDSLVTLSDHNARITCMRLFSLNETSLFRSETQREENFLVTSSCDHSIRLWWKGSCQRCFRGHNGPVSILSDKLLGDNSGKVLASGGEDGTVRLWSLSSSGKRGQHALKATLYGHEKPVNLMSVAGHKASLLVTISKDSKVRVWDTATSCAARSSCCVGMTSVPRAPVGMKCHESLLYVAAGSSVITIDLRTMQKVITAAICQPKLYSFEIMPSKSLICTGGIGKAMLWDIRRNQETLKPEPMAELEGHTGAVTLVHMDPYKIVTGGPEDIYLNVWEADTGAQTNSLTCCFPERSIFSSGCSAMAVNGCRIVTAGCGDEQGLVRFRDFTDATIPVSSYEEDEPTSKFWDPQTYCDSDS
ncbi:hypothetical protein L1049_003134 [Liquidambar formosana]|uniref:Uncharacterized protein n=1 Tax=Liquidambar formosana TaxID=63359 RepID=A0AAP0R7A2_LIQFO